MTAHRRLARASLPFAITTIAGAQTAPLLLLFRVTGVRDDIVIGLTSTELATMGTGAEAQRIARRLVEAGPVGAWRYNVGRAADGSARLGRSGRIAVLRNESLRIKGYRPALQAAPPPANGRTMSDSA